MKYLAFAYIIILLLSSSCATLDVGEIRNLEKVSFDSLVLKPDREVNDLRIDVIRQTYQKDVNDSTRETNDEPYHPLGFNLGNGLFCDLNDNLCIRIDYLMSFSSDKNFEIQNITRPGNNKGIIIYKFNNDSFTYTCPSCKKVSYNYHRIVNHDSISYMYKKRMNYAIIKTDSSLIYAGKKRRWDEIHEINGNHYYVNKRKWNREYQLANKELLIKDDYIVGLTNNGYTMKILRQGRRKNNVLYTLERSNNKIFIYDNRYYGIKIEQGENEISVYTNKTLLAKYKLIKQ